MSTSRVIARLTSDPWLIQPEALETMHDIAARGTPDQGTLEAWKSGRPRALEVRPGDALGNAPTARVRDGVAIVPVAGPIFRYANLFTDMSGATALTDFAANLQAAMADNRVRAILLSVDSPGGEVAGIAQAAQQIAAAARAKPVVAHVEGSAASAAYWLASAASAVVMDTTAMAGSLGVVVASTDRTDAESRAGVRRYRFVSSQTPNKLADPATEAGAKRMQALADRLAAEFLAAAAANRNTTVDALLAATDGGGMLVGADAVAGGLADSVGGFEETLARLADGDLAGLRGRSLPPAATAAPSAAEPPTGPIARATNQEPEMDPTIQDDAPAAAAPEIPTIAAAVWPAPADPVLVERQRVGAIMAAADPAQQALATLAIANGWPVEQFAAAQDANRAAVEAARAQGAAQANTAAFRDSLLAPVPGGAAPEAPAAGPEGWAAEYAANAALQAEFSSERSYVAFKQAEAAGKVRRITGAGMRR